MNTQIVKLLNIVQIVKLCRQITKFRNKIFILYSITAIQNKIFQVPKAPIAIIYKHSKNKTKIIIPDLTLLLCAATENFVNEFLCLRHSGT